MSKARILLVEDERVVAADIEECVKGLGYEVVGAAASGTEALRLAVRTQPDLVLMDIKLKGDLDGIDVAGALYDHFAIPVVYLTAHADAEILERAKSTAPAGYLLKPFDDRTMRTALEIAFDRHQRERQLKESGVRLATALGSMEEAVIVTQEHDRIAVMNRMAEALTGWEQDEALGRPLSEVFTMLNAETGSPLPSPAGRVYREGVCIGLGENALLLSKNGYRTPIQGSVTPVHGDNTTVGACLLFRTASRHPGVENWGAAGYGSVCRLEILGRLTGAVAQKFSSLLESDCGRARATQLAKRLLAFGQRQPAGPGPVDLHELIGGLEDLLRCALGDEMELCLTLAPDAGLVKADAGLLELLLMTLAIAAHDDGSGGRFSIETAMAACEEKMGGDYAVIATRQEGAKHDPALDCPVLDEIIRGYPGEIRVFDDDKGIGISLPTWN